jgi:hypothetical protein
MQNINPGIFNIDSSTAFNDFCLEIFHYQFSSNKVYRGFAESLGRIPGTVMKVQDIPFLPVVFFKSHEILCGNNQVETTFTSSSTGGGGESRHFVVETALYEQSFLRCFKLFYGDLHDYTILALLPSYLERKGSSLIYMVDKLMHESGHPLNGYFLYNHQELFQRLATLQASGQKTILFGVSFALLDFMEKFRMNWPGLIIMETGGMKGRRKEIIREELHERIKEGFGVASVHSEYGMTELLSQSYSCGDGRYFSAPWMKILIRDMNDPLSYISHGKSGGINIIDLANRDSCAFLSTSDLGKINPDGSFEVLGRFDHSDIRGCNLMVE